MNARSVEKISLVVVLALLIAAGGVRIFKKNPPAVSAPAVLGEVGDFTLTERGGKTVSRADLLGKVWIADFIFTRCAGICPLMSGKMKILQDRIGSKENLRFVSFSVDPEYDTPEVLAKYAERYKADPEKWIFLTGDKKTIHGLSLQHFHLGVGDIPEEERSAPDQMVSHSSRFVLVDGAGKIRGYYNTDEPSALEKLAADALKITG